MKMTLCFRSHARWPKQNLPPSDDACGSGMCLSVGVQTCLDWFYKIREDGHSRERQAHTLWVQPNLSWLSGLLILTINCCVMALSWTEAKVKKLYNLKSEVVTDCDENVGWNVAYLNSWSQSLSYWPCKQHDMHIKQPVHWWRQLHWFKPKHELKTEDWKI